MNIILADASLSSVDESGKVLALLDVTNPSEIVPLNLKLRAKHGSRENFLQGLEQLPDVEPPEYYRLPEGYLPKSI